MTWGVNGTRRRTAESTWKQVEKWDRRAGKAGERWRVFPSLCDPFEDWRGFVLDHRGIRIDIEPHMPMTMADVRSDFFALIDRTPNLDWLLLTKRPENVPGMWCSHVNTDGLPPSKLHRKNVWLLYSASDQATLESGLPHLLACRDLVPVLGLSLEPLIGPVDLGLAHLKACPHGGAGKHVCDAVDWVIVGGESGPNARPCDVEWIRSIVRQCQEAGVPCFVKQLGANAYDGNRPLSGQDCIKKRREEFAILLDPKGGDLSEWPEDLRVQEFPR